MHDESCRAILERLDAFADGQLPDSDAAGVKAHLAACPHCARFLSDTHRLKNRVRDVGRATVAPPGLETRIRASLRSDRSASSWFPAKIGIAFASVALLTVGVWSLAYRPLRHQISHLIGIGVGDHIHCTLERKVPPMGELFRDTEPDYPGLQAAVKSAMPADFQLLEAHYCHNASRRFAHLVYQKEGRRLSVIVTRKQQGEAFPAASILASLKVEGIPVYDEAGLGDQSLTAAGFETAGHLAFVVSNFDSAGNLRIAGLLAPTIATVSR